MAFSASSLASRIKRRTSSIGKYFSKLRRKFSKPVNEKKLLEQLAASGIRAGDTIMVHSSLSRIGNLEGGAPAVIHALLKTVGENGNVVMPAFSLKSTMENTANDPTYFFDPRTSPSSVGIITETFRKFPAVKRSIHPTHSVCASGAKAEFITEGHATSATNFGKDTPFERVLALDGKLVGLGIGMGPVTIYHALEDLHPELFSDVYLPEQKKLRTQIDGVVTERAISIHAPEFHRKRIDKDVAIESWMMRHMKARGILHEFEFGESISWWMNVRELFDELLHLREKGITIYSVPNA